MRYIITATVTRTNSEGWESTKHMPTFLLDARIQGITSADHAARIAKRMISDITADNSTCTVYAMSEDHTDTAYAE